MGEYYAVIRSTDHLAHYGIKGMKWGVRKAIALGDSKKLNKEFNRAAKKLSKLQDKALNSKKYAAKATAYGAAAAGTGALVVKGNDAASSLLNKFRKHKQFSHAVAPYLSKSGLSNSSKERIANAVKDAAGIGQNVSNTRLLAGSKIYDAADFVKKNAKAFRIGAAIATAGLGAAAAKNAYVAANGRKYLDKADTFRKAMDDTFAGTKYENKYVAIPKTRKVTLSKKRRKNNG